MHAKLRLEIKINTVKKSPITTADTSKKEKKNVTYIYDN